MMFDRAVIARAQFDAAAMRESIHAERLVTQIETDPLTHRLGHAAKAAGVMLIALGDRLDRHEDCTDSLQLPQPGLAHK